MNINADTAWLLASRSGAQRRAVRRALVRRWECKLYGVEVVDFAPSADDVMRSRLFGRDSDQFPGDLLADRAAEFEEMAEAERVRGRVVLADRLRAILSTSSVAEEIDAPSGSGWLVAWMFHNDSDSPTPHELAQRVKARRSGR